MTPIKTLVYLDLEATGLKSSGRPRITELSLVAVNLRDVLGENLSQIETCLTVSSSCPELCERKRLDTKNRAERQMFVEQLQPRVLNKLSLCFYPMTPIMPTVTELTGLDNYNLEDQAQFDVGTVELLQGFLSRLPEPVCLVAHNGDKYDFPLLLAELNKCSTALKPTVLCVDSYLGCQEILLRRNQKQIESEELKSLDELLSNGSFDDVFDEDDTAPLKRMKTEDSVDEFFTKSRISAAENDTTPARKKTGGAPSEVGSTKKTVQSLITSSFKPRKRLFPGSKSDQSLSLGSLHSRLLGVPPVQSHGAEADCLALLRVTSALGQDWLDYVNNNYKPLGTCQPMWKW